MQLTTDGHKPYLEAVEGAFGAALDEAAPVPAKRGPYRKRQPAVEISN